MPLMGNRVVPISKQYESIKQNAGSVKDRSQLIINQTPAGTSRAQVLNMMRLCVKTIPVLDALTADPTNNTAINNYAKAQGEPASTDIGTDYPLTKTQMNNFITFVKNNMPKDANGNYVIYADDATEGLVDIFLTVAQKNAVNTQLNALVATID